MIPLGLGLSSLTTMLFNCPITSIMPIFSRSLIGTNNEEEHYEVLVNRQTKDNKKQGTHRNYVSILTGSTVVVQCNDERTLDPWYYRSVLCCNQSSHQ